MASLTITPGRPLQGTISVPGDKSITHRAIILTALANGVSTVARYCRGEDCLNTMRAFQALGIRIDESVEELRVYGKGLWGLTESSGPIDCGNSGTGIRLLTGLLAGQDFFTVLTGDESIRRRPMGRIVKPLREMGATIAGRKGGELAPLAVMGSRLRAITYTSPVASAQIKSALFNQHAKWLEICNHLSWRDSIASLNLLITSTVWRQDHNGFTHQDPGFLDVVVNKSANVTRIYLPPDVNSLLSVVDHCLRSQNYINVIVCDKQMHLQYMAMDNAIIHCTKGIGIWDQASNDQGGEPDVVMASAGDIPTQEALAATAMLRQEFPDIKIRFINVIDLFKLQPSTEHPHGLAGSGIRLVVHAWTSPSSSISMAIPG